MPDGKTIGKDRLFSSIHLDSFYAVNESGSFTTCSYRDLSFFYFFLQILTVYIGNNNQTLEYLMMMCPMSVALATQATSFLSFVLD